MRARALRRLGALLIALVAIFSSSPRALAQAQPEQPTSPAKLPRRAANYAWDKTLLRATFSFRDAVDANITNKLSSGITQVIALRAYTYRDGDDKPISLSVRSCNVKFDPWDEIFYVRITEPGRARDTAAVNVEGVLRLCAEAHDLPLVDRARLTAGDHYFVAAIVDVNPISPEVLEAMRRWMTRPRGSAGTGSSDAIFGSFTEVFLRQVATTDRTVKFRTQDIVP